MLDQEHEQEVQKEETPSSNQIHKTNHCHGPWIRKYTYCVDSIRVDVNKHGNQGYFFLDN